MADQITAAVRDRSLLDELHHNAYRELLKLSWNDAAGKLMHLYNTHTAGSPGKTGNLAGAAA
jgi:hypothetical protein